MKKNKNLIKIFVLIGCTHIFTMCRNNESNKFFHQSSHSVLPIVSTQYFFKNYQIFMIPVTEPIKYKGFLNDGYFAMNDKIIYEVSLSINCKESYKQKNYEVEPQSRDISLTPKICDIYFYEFFSTQVKLYDTVSNINPEFDWTILKAKFYDFTLKDSIFIFEKKTNYNQYIGFTFSLSEGFMGLYGIIKDKNGNIVTINNAFGKIYADKQKQIYPYAEINFTKSPNIKYMDVDLSLIKEFKKID